MTFLTSECVYSNELDRWFLPKEQITLPNYYDKDCNERAVNTFSYSIQYDEDRNEDLDELSDEGSEMEGKRIFYSIANVSINGFSFEWEYNDSYFEKFTDFFNNIDKKEFSVISIDEYDYLRILVWFMGRGIRVIFQDYSYHDKVREVVDIYMDSVSFISKFKRMLNSLQKKHDEYKQKFNRLTDTIGMNYFDTTTWRWALVGNIIGEHEYGEEKEIRYGTKHFSSGTKVYCAPAHWGDGYENIVVIGKHRKSPKYIETIIPAKMVENFRLQKVYKPVVLQKMESENSWGFWGNTDEDKEKILSMLEWLNKRNED